MAAKRGLTEKQVAEIIKRYRTADGERGAVGKIAKAFKVSEQMVYYYARRAKKERPVSKKSKSAAKRVKAQKAQPVASA